MDENIATAQKIAAIVIFLSGCSPAPAWRTLDLDATRTPSPNPEGMTKLSFVDDSPPTRTDTTPTCNPQEPFAFLLRENYTPVSTRAAAHEEAIRFRTERYGYVQGFGARSWSSTIARDETAVVWFFNLPVQIHRKVVPALKCVEAEIKSACVNTPYMPEILSGLRNYNSFHSGEVTNHLYGIAIDVDPHKNSCCNCVGEWQRSRACRNRATPIWKRMAMPKCWVDVFEKYGFYWLGHDKLEDTMHFEFLADPDRIVAH